MPSWPTRTCPRETDCLLEGTGFELSVPREIGFVSRLCRSSADLSCGELRAPISEAGCSTTDRTWKSAAAIKVNPDSPQRPLRAEALRRGITVFVPTPRLRGGFKKLDPRRIPPDKIEAAASLSRGDRWSEEVALADMPGLDALVCGSVAVTRDGRRCGKGEGYSDPPARKSRY
jgi:5-formyltetrahydrofolate cyclo-ligase family